jgi:hypothetical protein
MAKPIVKQGEIITTHEVDKETGKAVVKRRRRIFTDAVGPNATVPDEGNLEEAIKDALDQTAGQDIDGLDLAPI